MANLRGSARLLWTINRLNAMNRSDSCHLKDRCREVGVDYSKVNDFLEISNGIMSRTADLGQVIAQYKSMEEQFAELAKYASSPLLG